MARCYAVTYPDGSKDWLYCDYPPAAADILAVWAAVQRARQAREKGAKSDA